MSEITADSLVIAGRRSGRPCRYGTKADRRIEILVTPDQKADLERVAKEERMNVSDVIREAVNELVSDYREKRVFGNKDRRFESY